MTKRSSYKHLFVETLPEKLEEGVLYVSGQYATSAHKCFCGCGREVVTPIHPTKWRLTFDGINVSLFPSVGSWSLNCKSHYWLQNGKIEWAENWSEEKIDAARWRDKADQDWYFKKADEPISPAGNAEKPASLWHRMADWFKGV